MYFEILLTKDFLIKSYTRRLFRNWWKIGIAFCLIFIGIILDLMSSGLGHISTIGLTLMAICVLIYSAVWYRQVKYFKRFIAKQGDTPVRYKLTMETIETESLLGESKLRWDAFKRLRIRNLDTLIEFTSAGALTLPTNQLNTEILEFLQDRFSAHGIKILSEIKHVGHQPVSDR